MATKLTKPVTRELPPRVGCPCCGTADEVGPQTFLVALLPKGPFGVPAIAVRRRGERRGQVLSLEQFTELMYRYGTRVELKAKKPAATSGQEDGHGRS